MQGDDERRKALGWIAVSAASALAVVVTAVVGLTHLVWQGRAENSVAEGTEYVDIGRVPVAPSGPLVRGGGSVGSWRSECGRNENGIHNADNVIVSPGVRAGAHHVHDYVGNVSTNAFSTDQSLAAAATTCRNGDGSTYYWPVLRVPSGSSGMHHEDGVYGSLLVPDSVLVEFRGNPVSNVVPMPRFLRALTGNPHGYTEGGVGTERVQWTCSGARDRVARKYPSCPPGQQVVRVFDFPSCWNGKTTDSANHRLHLLFPTGAGECPADTFPVPQLHLEVAYTVPKGVHFTVDSFPEERNSPISDHAGFIDVMPDSLMAAAVGCINGGKHCKE